MIRSLTSAALGGFVFGSLFYGLILAVLHLLYNGLDSIRDAGITWLFFSLAYGIWAAGVFVVARLGAALLHRWRRRSDEEAADRLGTVLGIAGFHLLFWELFFLYGLTYDQIPVLRPSQGGGMALWLLGAAFLIAIAAVITAPWLGALLRRLVGPARPALLGILYVLGLAIALSTVVAAPERPVLEAAGPETTERTVPTLPEDGLQVALIGLDGADWQVIDPMIAAGELPTFEALRRAGSTASLATIPDSNSSVIWASIYTGLLPAEHGILDFYRIQLPFMDSLGLFPVHRTFFKELAGPLERLGLARRLTVSRLDLRAPTLWEIVDQTGGTIGVIDGYFYSFPAFTPTQDDSFFLSYGLKELGDRLDAGTGRAEDVGLFLQPAELFRELRPELPGADFYWQSGSLLGPLASRPQPRFLNFRTHEPDASQHWYWKWYEPNRYLWVDEAEVAAEGDRIPQLYRDFDAFLATYMERQSSDTVTIIASDHGHSPTMVHEFYTQHRHGPPGILLMSGGPVKAGHVIEAASIYDLLPTVLYLLGLPVPEDAAGKVLLDALDPAFVASQPVRTIPTYRGLWPDLWAGAAGADETINQLEIEKLKALGYL